ncbi:heavy-metal-associated domain-containing protein [Candidatus Pacearchaeota archaeon]|nr:heavy-metal-associated domain-containing protein [Candidatus Pacearchaeota archaeon]
MLEEKTINVKGIKGCGCADSLAESLKCIGVEKVCIDAKSGKVNLKYDSCKVDYEKIKGKIKDSGYEIECKSCCK